MTGAEREDFDTNPLWSEQGQVIWLLEQRADNAELLPISGIAAELRLQSPAVANVLRELRAQGKVDSRTAERRELWGAPEQVQRLVRAERQAEAERDAYRRQVLEHNQTLEEIRLQLEEILAGHAIAVSSLERSFPRRSPEPRPDQLVIHVSDPEEATWLFGRLRVPAPDEGKPSDERWSDYADHLDQLLSTLDWAGWFARDNDSWSEYDRESGSRMYTLLRRTCMAVDVEYAPEDGKLCLEPYVDVTGEWPEVFSMLDDEVVIELGGDLEQQARTVADRVGELGLLDATHIEIDEDSDLSLGEFMAAQYAEWIFDDVAEERGVPFEQLIAELQQNQTFSTYFRFVVGIAGAHVLPDCVPDAAALGVATWCWRNDTAVEAWHLPDDVLMARVSIAVTKAIQPHVDPCEGIDWASIHDAVTDPALALPDGRMIAGLFGEGWPEVKHSVVAQLQAWQHLDEKLLGPQATLRLLTIGGSTSYTRHWWGQGRWKAICGAIVTDATQANIPLPEPYDHRGTDALLASTNRTNSAMTCSSG